jgi:hypothetical protein
MFHHDAAPLIATAFAFVGGHSNVLLQASTLRV